MLNAKRITNLCIVLLLAVMMTACGSLKQHVRPDADLPDFTKDKVLILPAYISGLPGDNLKQSAALFGGFVAAFEKQGVSLQPLMPAMKKMGIGYLPKRMTNGMYHMVTFHNTYDFKKDAGYHGGNSHLPAVIDATAKLVKFASKKLKLGFSPKYVAAISVTGWRKYFSRAVKMRVVGGLYNIKTGLLEKVIIKEKTMMNNETAVLAELAQLGGGIKAALEAKAEE